MVLLLVTAWTRGTPYFLLCILPMLTMKPSHRKWCSIWDWRMTRDSAGHPRVKGRSRKKEQHVQRHGRMSLPSRFRKPGVLCAAAASTECQRRRMSPAEGPHGEKRAVQGTLAHLHSHQNAWKSFGHNSIENIALIAGIHDTRYNYP